VNPFGEAINLLANASHFAANPHTSLLMPQLSKNLSQSPPKNPPRPSKKNPPNPLNCTYKSLKMLVLWNPVAGHQ
jgi:hypothetical protein